MCAGCPEKQRTESLAIRALVASNLMRHSQVAKRKASRSLLSNRLPAVVDAARRRRAPQSIKPTGVQYGNTKSRCCDTAGARADGMYYDYDANGVRHRRSSSGL